MKMKELGVILTCYCLSHTHTHTHTYIHTRKHIHTRTYRHAHTHTYKICLRFFWIFENLRHMGAKKHVSHKKTCVIFADTGKLTIMTMTIKKLQLWPHLHLNGRKCTHIYTSRPPPHSKTVRRLFKLLHPTYGVMLRYWLRKLSPLWQLSLVTKMTHV